jgi:hypothetical protein
MDNLNIKGTSSTPTVLFNENGKLKIQGRIITENAAATFAPMFEWIEELKIDRVHFTIELDYMNTGASMKLLDLLHQLEEKKDIGEIKVRWHYEEDDEDHLETGKLFEQRLDRTQFEFVKILEGQEV